MTTTRKRDVPIRGGFRNQNYMLSPPLALFSSSASRDVADGNGGDSGDPRLQVDEQGRTLRRRSQSSSDTAVSNNSSWDDFEPSNQQQQGTTTTGGWDDFDPTAVEFSSKQGQSRQKPPRIRSSNNRTAEGQEHYSPLRKRGNNRSSASRDGGRHRDGHGSSSLRFRDGNYQKKQRKGDDDDSSRRINMKALEGAGFVHLYGLSSVLNALQANRRDFTNPESVIDLTLLEGNDLEHELKQRERKPEAQYSPWLFIQENRGNAASNAKGGGRQRKSGRSADKAIAAEQVEQLAAERNVPVARVDKGVLNTLSGNRPHQGYVLRCGALSFDSLTRIPLPTDSSDSGEGDDEDAPPPPNLWLVLDEVMDPQNLGALLRSAYFLGGNNVGVLVCAKNSAPPSPVVSAASAGALESMNRIWSTSNLPRTLHKALEDGFRIVGASSSVPQGEETRVYELNELPTDERPTLLVLGSEGSGLRTLVARACTEFVRIPGAGITSDDTEDDNEDASGVDSLNVSVTGGILLWHLLQKF